MAKDIMTSRAGARLGPASFTFTGIVAILFVLIVAVIFFQVFGRYFGNLNLIQFGSYAFGFFILMVMLLLMIPLVLSAGRRYRYSLTPQIR